MTDRFSTAVCYVCGGKFPEATLVDHIAEAHDDEAVAGHPPGGDLLRPAGRADAAPGTRCGPGSGALGRRRRPLERPRPSRPTARADLPELVARELEELTADVAGPAPAEPGYPALEPDPAYDAAMAAALRTCPHPDVEGTLFDHQWRCLTCGRTLDREAMRRRGGPGAMWFL